MMQPSVELGDPAPEPTEATAPDQPSSTIEYLRTRISSLKPPMARVENPCKLLHELTKRDWMNFGVALAAWTWDGFDFFTVSMTLEDLAATFGKSQQDITWGISITLMCRPIGAVLFGILSDRYGRKWPFIVNNLMFIVFELATGFCTTFSQFLWVRAFFGIAMGGIWGNIAATALEDAPPKARGILSGMLQQGYMLGFLMAVVFTRILVNTTPHGWRPLFWFGACPPILIILFRLWLPETNAFVERQQLRHATHDANAAFLTEGKVVFRRKCLLLIYLVLLMTGMNFMSHGSQDLYPTMLKNTLEFTPDQVTVTQVVASLGAITGGTLGGYYSQVFGRRLSILVLILLGAALLYPYTYTEGESILVPAFFFQFCVQGAWGVVPIHLLELSPPKYSTFFAGTGYQLGNLISATAATIEARIAEHYPLPPTSKAPERFDYGKVICILMSIVFAYLFVIVLIGPEKRGQEFDATHDDITLEKEFSVRKKQSDATAA